MPVVPFSARPEPAPTGPEVEDKYFAMAGAEMYKAGFFGDLFGSSDPKTDMSNAKAPPLSRYPSDMDARVAIENEFGYGRGNEDYIKGEHAEVLGMTDKKGRFNPVGRVDLKTDEWYQDEASTNVDLTKFKNIDTLNRVGTTMAQAAIAVNRNPVAAMGFDPRRTVLDLASGDTNVAGTYIGKIKDEEGPDTGDKVWANLPDTKSANASTVVHESIHRGIAKIRESGEADDLLKQLGVKKGHTEAEELLTRYMMYKYAGDPEGTLGKDDAGQRQEGIDRFEKFHPGMGKKVEALMELAANQLKNRRERGPI